MADYLEADFKKDEEAGELGTMIVDKDTKLSFLKVSIGSEEQYLVLETTLRYQKFI